MRLTAADEALAAQLRRELAATLRDDGALRSPSWQAAVRQAPRHTFLPRFYGLPRPDGTWPLVTPEAVGRTQWLRHVYTDETWVTQFDGTTRGADTNGDTDAPATAIPTSSSTKPGLIVRMLERLDAVDGDRVLVVGTGTGYSTALACERLGADNVVSIDVDPTLTRLARTRLAEAGWPRPATGRPSRPPTAATAGPTPPPTTRSSRSAPSTDRPRPGCDSASRIPSSS